MSKIIVALDCELIPSNVNYSWDKFTMLVFKINYNMWSIFCFINRYILRYDSFFHRK